MNRAKDSMFKNMMTNSLSKSISSPSKKKDIDTLQKNSFSKFSTSSGKMFVTPDSQEWSYNSAYETKKENKKVFLSLISRFADEYDIYNVFNIKKIDKFSLYSMTEAIFIIIKYHKDEHTINKLVNFYGLHKTNFSEKDIDFISFVFTVLSRKVAIDILRIIDFIFERLRGFLKNLKSGYSKCNFKTKAKYANFKGSFAKLNHLYMMENLELILYIMIYNTNLMPDPLLKKINKDLKITDIGNEILEEYCGGIIYNNITGNICYRIKGEFLNKKDKPYVKYHRKLNTCKSVMVVAFILYSLRNKNNSDLLFNTNLGKQMGYIG